MVDSIPAQVAVITPTGEVVTLNQPCLDYFGKTLDELKGWASSDPVHPDDLPHVIQVLTHALQTILRWCVLLTDIDDRKRAEAQLAGEKRLLEMVASGSALTDVLGGLCNFVEETAADCKCGIYLIDGSGSNFQLTSPARLQPGSRWRLNSSSPPCVAH